MSYWKPALCAKQYEFFNRRGRLQLACGPRLSGKTQVCLHKVCNHAWTVSHARISVLGVTQSANADFGAWDTLISKTLPEWIDAGFGMEWDRKPYIDGVSKKPKCSVINGHGTISKFQLDSLNNEEEVESKFKGKEFSCIYMCELSNFYKKATFHHLIEALRGTHIRYEDFTFLADTNPSDEGVDSWIYKLWYEFKNDGDVKDELKPFQDDLDLFEFTMDDNTFNDPRRVAGIKAQYAQMGQDVYDRYIKGLWTRSTGDGVFSDVFRPSLHVIEVAGEELLPEENCSELGTGTDLGDKNPSCMIVEPFQMIIENKPMLGFKILDELVYTGEMVSTEDFTLEMIEKMDRLEEMIGRKVIWRHFADRDRYSAQADNMEHNLVFSASQGRIDFREIERWPGSVQAGVALLRKLLFQGRLFVNGPRCPNVIAMFKSLRKPKNAAGIQGGHLQIDKRSSHKHQFDSLRYFIMSMLSEEIERAVWTPKQGKVEAESGLIEVGL